MQVPGVLAGHRSLWARTSSDVANIGPLFRHVRRAGHPLDADAGMVGRARCRPGDLRPTLSPSRRKCLPGPIPLRISRAGEPYAPAAAMTVFAVSRPRC